MKDKKKLKMTEYTKHTKLKTNIFLYINKKRINKIKIGEIICIIILKSHK